MRGEGTENIDLTFKKGVMELLRGKGNKIYRNIGKMAEVNLSILELHEL